MHEVPKLDEAAIAARVRQELSAQRFQHVEGVVKTAAELAARHGADVAKARLAAWLHDIAREWPAERLAEYARRMGVPDEFGDDPLLWHGPVAAALASAWFGVEDEDVANAIRYHTTGRAGMSTLEMVVFLADAIEPGREYPGVDHLRALAETDLLRAVAEAIDATISYLIATHRNIVPLTVVARNDLWQKVQQRPRRT